MSKAINFFEFYQLPVRFELEAGKLKRLFLLKSRESHPDFFTLASAEEQAHATHQASINNEAYKTLKDADLRTKHILELFHVIKEEEKYQLAPSFLMEMMEINEQLMDAAFNPEARQKINAEVDDLLNSLEANAKPLRMAFDQTKKIENLIKLKEIYFHRKYLLRIKEKLDTFATP